MIECLVRYEAVDEPICKRATGKRAFHFSQISPL